MRTLVTGMVAGMDDAEYIRKVVALGQRNHRDIKVYNTVDDFTKAGKKPLERLLVRRSTFRRPLESMSSKKLLEMLLSR